MLRGLMVLTFLGWNVMAQDKPAHPRAQVCTACHGAEGVSQNTLWPNLAGQKEGYLLEQLKAFHDGTRTNPLMGPVAKMLSESDMKELAAYFAGLKAP